MQKTNQTDKVSLLNLLTNSKYTNTFFSDVNFNIVTKITCKSETSSLEYESYNPVTNTYFSKLTDPEDKFIFNIYIKNISKPIQIICLNSRELEQSDITSYHYRGNPNYINELLDQYDLSQFIKYLSQNKLEHFLLYIGFVLGHLVNNNLDKLAFEIN